MDNTNISKDRQSGHAFISCLALSIDFQIFHKRLTRLWPRLTQFCFADRGQDYGKYQKNKCKRKYKLVIMDDPPGWSNCCLVVLHHSLKKRENKINFSKSRLLIIVGMACFPQLHNRELCFLIMWLSVQSLICANEKYTLEVD